MIRSSRRNVYYWENQAWKVRQFENEEVSIEVVLENVLGGKNLKLHFNLGKGTNECEYDSSFQIFQELSQG